MCIIDAIIDHDGIRVHTSKCNRGNQCNITSTIL